MGSTTLRRRAVRLLAASALSCGAASAPLACAAPDNDTCSALRPALSEVTTGLHGVQDPDTGKVNLDQLDPETRARKTKEFADHLRLASVLAHDTGGKLADREKAAAVERFATALDRYVESLAPAPSNNGAALPAGNQKAPVTLTDAVAELKSASGDFASLVRSSCGK